ncbi:hypothetical protein TNCV_2610921 [Trichonephila clavipes]|nr:hypothetical protein TNCV_2610921 [Trichonephila clavipes]
MTGVHLSPCHDEFRGPPSNYVRQVTLETTETKSPITTEISCAIADLSGATEHWQTVLLPLTIANSCHKGRQACITNG